MKPSMVEDERTVLRVSHMHYNQEMTKSAIAKALNISRPTVTKILKKAREMGIVTINVMDISGRQYYELEQALEDKYGLKEVYITKNQNSVAETREEIGKAAAKLIERYIKDDSIVGVSLGYTLNSIANYINDSFKPSTIFLPLVGGLGQIPQEIQGNALSEKLAKKFSGMSMPFYTPARITDEALLKELANEKTIKKVLKTAEKIDMAIVGIGGTNENSTLQQTGYLDAGLHKQLREDGICGDICMQFYDINGETDRFDINKEILTINLDILRHTNHSIGVCFGEEKVESIIGAINGGYINTLVTDLSTAKSLLDYPVEEKKEKAVD